MKGKKEERLQLGYNKCPTGDKGVTLSDHVIKSIIQ